MKKEILLSEFIKQLSRALQSSSHDGSQPHLASAEMTIQFMADTDDNGEIRFTVANSTDQNDAVDLHQLKIGFMPAGNTFVEQASVVKSRISDATKSELTLVDDEDKEDEDAFEGFKRRFQESVERNGGVPPNRKKNVFD